MISPSLGISPSDAAIKALFGGGVLLVLGAFAVASFLLAVAQDKAESENEDRKARIRESWRLAISGPIRITPEKARQIVHDLKHGFADEKEGAA
jgi:hypothetical protein